jgi:hypothetical protein
MIRMQLERILASETFSRPERLSGFLRFIVDQKLHGKADSLKEQVLACELYGRSGDFNAAADPIVRVDARRLRDKLREYYVEFAGEPVVINGTAILRFSPSAVASIASRGSAAQRAATWRRNASVNGCSIAASIHRLGQPDGALKLQDKLWCVLRPVLGCRAPGSGGGCQGSKHDGDANKNSNRQSNCGDVSGASHWKPPVRCLGYLAPARNFTVR